MRERERKREREREREGGRERGARVQKIGRERGGWREVSSTANNFPLSGKHT